MNSYVNMGVGAFLGTVFVLMSVSIASEGIFHSEVPEKEGFAIIAEEGASDAGAGATAEVEVDIKPLLASADAAAGATVFKKCASCHTADKGGANKVGPNLWGVVERPIASHEGFSYSAGMKTFAEANKTWTYDHLSFFVEAPKKHVPGTAMGFAGVKKPDERANLIAWLREQADAPVALPDATAAAAPAAEGEAAKPATEADAAKPATEGEATKPATETAPAQ
jgi:cytochrome c